MKKLNVFIITVGLSFFGTLPAFAARDGGGGSAPKSSPDEVREAIRDVHSTIDSIFLNLRIHFSIYGDSNIGDLGPFLTDSRTREILKDISTRKDGSDLAISIAISKSPFVPKEKGACLGKFKEDKDASVPKLRYPVPICYSVSKLSRFPSEYLYLEILALSGHELAHELGYEEVDAQKVQTFFRKSFRALTRQNGTDKIFTGLIRFIPQDVRDALYASQAGNISTACIELSKVSANAEVIQLYIQSTAFKSNSNGYQLNEGAGGKIASGLNLLIQSLDAVKLCERGDATAQSLTTLLRQMETEANALAATLGG